MFERWGIYRWGVSRGSALAINISDHSGGLFYGIEIHGKRRGIPAVLRCNVSSAAPVGAADAVKELVDRLGVDGACMALLSMVGLDAISRATMNIKNEHLGCDKAEMITEIRSSIAPMMKEASKGDRNNVELSPPKYIRPKPLEHSDGEASSSKKSVKSQVVRRAKVKGIGEVLVVSSESDGRVFVRDSGGKVRSVKASSVKPM